MPLTEKGSSIMKNMKETYGEKKGEEVFYASKNSGKISGVDRLLAQSRKPGVSMDTIKRLGTPRGR